jgi:hypothetical protein
MAKLTQARLKEVLNYDKETGLFTWMVSNSWCSEKDTAGTKENNGYIRISIDGNRYVAHRLAWLYVNGYFPENQIDHIDRARDNNKWVNLREVSTQCNIRNRGLNSNNTSGVAGVNFDITSDKWIARITVSRQKRQLGSSKDFIEMVALRLAAEQCVGWSGCDSSSSAYQYMQSIK